MGTAADWRLIEKELGFTDFDPSRRERLWRDLNRIFTRLEYAQYAPPEVRVSNYHHALDGLRRHTVRLFADLSPSGCLFPPPDGPPIRLSRGIEICDPDTLPADGLDDLDLWALAYLSRQILPYDKQQALLAGLAELIAEVDKMKEGLPSDKGGRERDNRIQGLIYELAHVYREWSGKKPGLSRYPPTHSKCGKPTGPFFRFVKLCFRTFRAEAADLVEVSNIGKTRPGDDRRLPSHGVDDQDEALAKRIQRVLKVKHWRSGISY